MYQIIVNAKERLVHPLKPEWESPKWSRVWETPSKRQAVARYKELRINYETVLLSVSKAGKASVVHV